MLDPSFYAADIKIYNRSKKGLNTGWIENNRCIFDDLEFQLMARVNVKTLGKNLKTPI